MAEVQVFAAGGYRYIKAVFQYSGGVAWHFCRPPVVGLEFEMDVRGAAREITL